MYPVLYWVEWCDKYIDDGRLQKISGCLFAKTVTEATKKICEYYGDDNISDLRISFLEEGSCLEFANYYEAKNILDKGI